MNVIERCCFYHPGVDAYLHRSGLIKDHSVYSNGLLTNDISEAYKVTSDHASAFLKKFIEDCSYLTCIDKSKYTTLSSDPSYKLYAFNPKHLVVKHVKITYEVL